MQLVEVELADVVDGLSRDGEQEAGRTDARALAVGAGVLHHHLVEPGLHPGTRFAALPVTAVVPLDAPRDAAEADLLAFPVAAFLLRLGRRGRQDFLLDAVEDRTAHLLGQVFPRRFEPQTKRARKALHHPPVPPARDA